MNKGGISFFGVLYITVFVLKIMGYITLSWWWLTLPIWLPIIIIIIIAIFGFNIFKRYF